jgi:chromosome segregation ATPase
MMGWMGTQMALVNDIYMSSGLFQKAAVVQKENEILNNRVSEMEAEIRSLKASREEEQTAAALEMLAEVDNLKDQLIQQRMEAEREQREIAKSYVNAVYALKSSKIELGKENATLIRERKELSKENRQLKQEYNKLKEELRKQSRAAESYIKEVDSVRDEI